jgi:hypothetical protein
MGAWSEGDKEMPTDAQSAINLSKAALQFGPFLFAILFIVVVPPYAHTIWRRSLSAANNTALLNESKWYFRSSWMFGMFLVLCSILWWGYTKQLDIISAREGQFTAYSGYVTGLAQEDQLLSASPEDNEYLVPANINGTIQYRFVYLSHKQLENIVSLTISYVNLRASAPSSGKGVAALFIPFKLKPGETHYEFVVDKEKGAMVVPVKWGAS